ncbi:hypothetical protein HKD37_08G022240 [Glycine soja]
MYTHERPTSFPAPNGVTIITSSSSSLTLSRLFTPQSIITFNFADEHYVNFTYPPTLTRSLTFKTHVLGNDVVSLKVQFRSKIQYDHSGSRTHDLLIRSQTR